MNLLNIILMFSRFNALTLGGLKNNLSFSFTKINTRNFSSFMTQSRFSLPMLENNLAFNAISLEQHSDLANFTEAINLITLNQNGNIIAEFMNKTNKLAKRKRAKRKYGKKISLRYR